MFLRHGGARTWTWIEEVEPSIDFCMWALLVDGLQVPPFDRHSPGSGQLRAAGLAATAWRAWLERVVAAQRALSRQVRGAGDLSTLTERQAANLTSLLARAAPPTAWNGDERIRAVLRSLWADYQTEGETWRRHLGESTGPADLTPRERHGIWQRLRPQLEPGQVLTVYVVRYPAPVVDVVAPSALILALGQERGPDAYLRLLREGITRLDGAGRTRQPSD